MDIINLNAQKLEINKSDCCTTLFCFVGAQKYHICNLIELTKVSSHTILNERVFIIMLNTIHEFGGKSS